MRHASVVIALLCLFACATAPVQDMSNARTALAAAEQAGARDSAPEAFNQAEGLLNQAQAEIESKNYAEARILAQKARDAAIQARTKAQLRPQGEALP